MAEAKTGQKKPGFFSKIGRFFREVKQEMKKISWPSKSKTLNNTLVVVVFMLIMAGLIFLVDFGLGHLVRLITDLLV